MPEPPFGYQFVDGKLSVHPYEVKIIKLLSGLSLIGLESEHIQYLFNDFEVPKRGDDYSYDLDEKIHEIYVAGAKLAMNNRLNKVEQSVKDVVAYLNHDEGNIELTVAIEKTFNILNVINSLR